MSPSFLVCSTHLVMMVLRFCHFCRRTSNSQSSWQQNIGLIDNAKCSKEKISLTSLQYDSNLSCVQLCRHTQVDKVARELTIMSKNWIKRVINPIQTKAKTHGNQRAEVLGKQVAKVVEDSRAKSFNFLALQVASLQ